MSVIKRLQDDWNVREREGVLYLYDGNERAAVIEDGLIDLDAMLVPVAHVEALIAAWKERQ